jgi:hypothetical protein
VLEAHRVRPAPLSTTVLGAHGVLLDGQWTWVAAAGDARRVPANTHKHTVCSGHRYSRDPSTQNASVCSQQRWAQPCWEHTVCSWMASERGWRPPETRGAYLRTHTNAPCAPVTAIAETRAHRTLRCALSTAGRPAPRSPTPHPGPNDNQGTRCAPSTAGYNRSRSTPCAPSTASHHRSRSTPCAPSTASHHRSRSTPCAPRCTASAPEPNTKRPVPPAPTPHHAGPPDASPPRAQRDGFGLVGRRGTAWDGVGRTRKKEIVTGDTFDTRPFRFPAEPVSFR